MAAKKISNRFPIINIPLNQCDQCVLCKCNELAQQLLLCALAPSSIAPLWVPLCAHISFQTGSSARHKEALFNLSKPGMRHKNVTREQRIQFFFFAGSETVSTKFDLSETNPCNQWFLSQSAQLDISFVKSSLSLNFSHSLLSKWFHTCKQRQNAQSIKMFSTRLAFEQKQRQ